jgi:hypothetical protein
MEVNRFIYKVYGSGDWNRTCEARPSVPTLLLFFTTDKNLKEYKIIMI